MGKDYYKILGVPRAANEREIKRAYRKMALKYFPDTNTNTSPGAEEEFKDIAEAYEVLSNKEKREIFDKYGVEGLKRTGGGAPNGGFTYESHGDPFEILSCFFGNDNPFGNNVFGEQLQKFENLPKSADPPVTVAQILAEAKLLSTTCDPIVNKPKPKVEPPIDETKQDEDKKEGGKDGENTGQQPATEQGTTQNTSAGESQSTSDNVGTENATHSGPNVVYTDVD